MARLEIIVQGKLGEMSAGYFVLIFSESLQILASLDRAVSEVQRGTLDWVISGLRESSAVLDLESRTKRGRVDYGREVAGRFTDGMNTIALEGVTPPLYSEASVTSVLKIVRTFGREGIDGLKIRSLDTSHSAEITSDAEGAIQQLVGVHHVSIGSIEGRIEAVSIRKGRRRFTIYHERTQKAIRCTLPYQLEGDIIEAMRQHRRVIVHGLIAYNAKGEPQSIQVQRGLRILGQRDELPTPKELLGAIPDITNGLTTAEHLQRLRDG